MPKLDKRLLLWFSPLLALPVLWLQSPLPNQQTPSQAQKPNTVASPAAFSVQGERKPVQSSSSGTSGKSAPLKSVLQKPQQSPKKVAATKSSPKSKARPRPYTAPAIEIRVALAQNANGLAIASSTKANITDVNGRRVDQLPPGQAFPAVASNSTVTFSNWQTPLAIWIEPMKGGAVYVGDRWYRGKLLLVAQGDKLVAVNHVGLEQYLASVVGSEMSATAPIEALKAQAIAARSYALVHTFRPASSLYDLGNDERHQAYKGIATEYNTTHQAVSETAGQVLSYKGGVVESLYGATQAIVDKAHNGMGMSQTGAYAYATQGYNHQQILGIYYSGVAIARLEAKQ